MKKKLFKRLMSLVLVVVMAVSTMAVSASAATTNVTYKFEIHTAGTNGKSSDKISIKVNGDNVSTGWHDVGPVAFVRTDSASFDDIDVGTIKSITVKNSGSNGWYPEYINVTVGEKNTTIYGGRWIDDQKEVTLSVTDKVAKVTVKTSDVEYAGTDNDVYVQLFSHGSSEQINLSDIHPKINAFERNDKATFFILVPENCDRVREIATKVDNDVSDYDWSLDYIDVTLDSKTQRFYDPETTSGACICFDSHNKKSLRPAPYIYKVTVKTSDVKNAGTDNDVDLYAYDINDDIIRLFTLDNSENNFERNDTDVFYITTSRKIDNIRMATHGSRGTKWKLNYVQIDQLDISNGKEDVVESVKYNFNKWFKNCDNYAQNSVEVLK